MIDHSAKVHQLAQLGVNARMAGSSILADLAYMQFGLAIGYCVQLASGTFLERGAPI